MAYTEGFMKEMKRELEELKPEEAQEVLKFLLGYMHGSGERDGHAAFLEGLSSGIITYGKTRQRVRRYRVE